MTYPKWGVLEAFACMLESNAQGSINITGGEVEGQECVSAYRHDGRRASRFLDKRPILAESDNTALTARRSRMASTILISSRMGEKRPRLSINRHKSLLISFAFISWSWRDYFRSTWDSTKCLQTTRG